MTHSNLNHTPLPESKESSVGLASAAREIVQIDALAREKIESAAVGRKQRLLEYQQQKDQLASEYQEKLNQALVKYRETLQKELDRGLEAAKREEDEKKETFERIFDGKRETLVQSVYDYAVQFAEEI